MRITHLKLIQYRDDAPGQITRDPRISILRALRRFELYCDPGVCGLPRRMSDVRKIVFSFVPRPNSSRLNLFSWLADIALSRNALAALALLSLVSSIEEKIPLS